ncbi:MAG: PAS domain S-box protein, partial [Candidatus Omnitrophica bacterium]|nr:PAS domain S-box protein [Candidatus Omnitrophota bacterium]
MKSDLRRSGIEIIGEVPWGTHFCQFYRGKEDLLEILVPYFKQGLENNEFCMWVTSEPLGVEDAKAALEEKVKNLDEYIKKGQIEILDYSQWYTKTGRFETDKVLEGWVKKEEQAVERGFDGLRLTGNTFWLENKDWENFADYEAIVNSVIGKYRMLAVCSYSLDRCQASEIVDVVSNHQFALIKKEGKWVSLESSERKRAEEEIASLAKFPSENPLPVLRVAEDGTILYSNEKGLKILAGWDTKVGSKVPERWCRLVKERFDTGKTGQEEEEEEEDKIFSIMIAPIKEAGYANLYFHDITERKKAQETLRASEIKNRTLLENIPQKVFFKDKNLVYISCNENYARDLKIKPEEIAGKTDYDFYPKDLAEKYRNDDKRIMESGKTEDIEEKYIQDEEERFVHTSKTPVKDAQRNVVGILGIFWDITEQKNIEEALCKNEARYRSSIELTGQLAWTTDSNGEVVEDIPLWRKFTGLSYEETKGSGWTKAVHPEDTEHTSQVWGKAVKDKSAYEVEYRLRRFDGVYRDFLTRGIPVLKEDGSIREWVGVNIDITERRQADEELRGSEEKFKNLIETTSDWVWECDEEGRYTYVSPKVKDLLGYEASEILGKTAFDLMAEDEGAKIGKIFKEKSAKKEAIYGLENTNRHKDGHLVILETSGVPVFDDEGQLKGYRGIDRDITERK